MSSIANWAQILIEADDVMTFEKACDIINKYAKSKGYKFSYSCDPKHNKFDKYDKIEDVLDKKTIEKEFADWLGEAITQDDDTCEKYGIEIIDDSDYDREYGYGTYTYPNERDVERALNDIIPSISDELKDEFVKMMTDFNNQTKYTDLDDYLDNGGAEQFGCDEGFAYMYDACPELPFEIIMTK